MSRFILFIATCLLSLTTWADDKLTGTVIGTTDCVDYSNGSWTTTVNTRENAFDGKLNTFFATWERRYTWAGLDLGTPHVITKVGWSPRNDGLGPGRVVLGVFEGSNREDFMDAVPLYVIDKEGTIGTIDYADVNCSKGFRYVRYVGPADARCNIAELEFYGYEGEGEDSHYYQPTNLPVLSIHTLNGEIPYDKEHQITSHFVLISDNGKTILSQPGTTRERGNGSRTFPKRPYRIKFDTKQRVLNSPAKAKKWTLINNYGDKTLMRNLLAFEMSRLVKMPYTPFASSVDVLLNGEFIGNYQLSDQVTVNKNRVNITEMKKNDNSGSALTGGYFFEIDAYANEEPVWFNSNQGNPVTVKSPDSDSITTQQLNYLKNYFNKTESQWSTYLDLNTFLRHFIVGELSGNTDTYWSVFMYKERDDNKVYTGPVWDFDLGFENDNRTYPVNNKSDYIYRTNGSCAGNMRYFVDRIVVNNATAKRQLYNIWDEVRQGGLTEERMLFLVDSLAEELDASQRLNFLRWPIMNEYVHQNPRIYGSYEGEVNNVRNFISKRFAWMDNKLGYTYTPPTGITEQSMAERDAIDYVKPYRIYTISGIYCGNDISVLSPDIYIIRQGKTVCRVVIAK